VIAFEILHNGKLIATAGRSDVELLLAIVRWVPGKADVEINGQAGSVTLSWPKTQLLVGDEVRIRVVETEMVSAAERRHAFEVEE
jgi:DNA-directed RNA polymerase subunit E'/Rpb7